MDIVFLWPYLNTIKISWEICSAIHFNAYSGVSNLLEANMILLALKNFGSMHELVHPDNHANSGFGQVEKSVYECLWYS